MDYNYFEAVCDDVREVMGVRPRDRERVGVLHLFDLAGGRVLSA